MDPELEPHSSGSDGQEGDSGPFAGDMLDKLAFDELILF
jgi:hypothetical protein